MDTDYFFVEKHNEQVRNFWHDRLTTISCRVESTIKGVAGTFAANIISFLYNENREELEKESNILRKRDRDLIQKEFGLDQKDLSNRESFQKAMQISNLSKGEVWDVLGLYYVGSARIRGFYKELFYLRCLIDESNPQFLLRCLYYIQPKKSPDREPFDSIKAEIQYLLENVVK